MYINESGRQQIAETNTKDCTRSRLRPRNASIVQETYIGPPSFLAVSHAENISKAVDTFSKWNFFRRLLARSSPCLGNLQMSSSCSGLLSKYVECLRSTDCMAVENKDVKECMKERPSECEQFRFALFQCRKGQVDARTRIQGNKGY